MLVANPGVGDARVMNEAESLVAAGHSITVYCLAGCGFPATELVAGARYVRLPEWHSSASATATPAPAGTFAWLKTAVVSLIQHELHSATFLEAVAAARPDIVHAHGLDTLPAAVRAAKRCGARVIYDMHELEEGQLPAAAPLMVRWKTSLERRYLRSVAASIAVSPSTASSKARKYNIPLPTVVLNAPCISVTAPADSDPCARVRWQRQARHLLEVYDAVANSPRGLPAAMARRALATALRPAAALIAGSL